VRRRNKEKKKQNETDDKSKWHIFVLTGRFCCFGEIANECLSAMSTTLALNCSAVSPTPLTTLSPVSMTLAIDLCHDLQRSAVSLILGINLSPVSMTPLINYLR
jgi:hypothetical protein